MPTQIKESCHMARAYALTVSFKYPKSTARACSGPTACSRPALYFRSCLEQSHGFLRGHRTLSSRWSGVNSGLSSHVTVFDRYVLLIFSAVNGFEKPTRGNKNIRSDVAEPRPEPRNGRRRRRATLLTGGPG